MEKRGLSRLVKGVQVLAIVCNQWGDTGKGKFSHFFSAHWAEVIARGTGGNNAGHTIIFNGKEKIFHLLPAGIVYDNEGKVTILGNGMVIDLKVLLKELKELEDEGLTYDNLMISQDANVVMPYHINADLAKNQSQKDGGIGSTGRGIGPCYSDKIARRGILIKDLYDEEALRSKLNKIKEFYPEQEILVEFLIERLRPYSEKIKPYVKDTVNEIHRFYRQGKKILLEGAQGLLLSIEHGTYPYVTSSDCSVNGTATGVGLSAGNVDLVLGVIKFPFMTRVGAGPFPTELGNSKSEEYCAKGTEHDVRYELKTYNIPFKEENGSVIYNRNHPNIQKLIVSKNEFEKGVGIRLAAGEYGATTKRPRRVGWTDAVAAKYAVGINGVKFVLTKADCLNGHGTFKICYGYRNEEGTFIEFNKDVNFLKNVEPVYKEYKAYGNIDNVSSYNKLPGSLKQAIKDFEKFTGGVVVALSNGPSKDQVIIK